MHGPKYIPVPRSSRPRYTKKVVRVAPTGVLAGIEALSASVIQFLAGGRGSGYNDIQCRA